MSFYPFVLHEISVLIELTLGHLRYHLTDVPPQPNSQPDSVFDTDRPANGALILENEPWSSLPLNRISKKTIRVVVFHFCITAPTYSTPPMSFHKVRLESSWISEWAIWSAARCVTDKSGFELVICVCTVKPHTCLMVVRCNLPCSWVLGRIRHIFLCNRVLGTIRRDKISHFTKFHEFQ